VIRKVVFSFVSIKEFTKNLFEANGCDRYNQSYDGIERELEKAYYTQKYVITLSYAINIVTFKVQLV